MGKVILFGGSFDPIHNGHLNMAREALKSLNGDKVIFILSKNPRWKNPKGDAEARLEMIEEAIRNYQDFELSTFEVDHDVHYSIETVRHFEKILPNDELYFLIGDDQLEKLHDWYEIDELAKKVNLIAYGRNNSLSELNARNRQKYRVGMIEGPLNSTSSTMIRNMQSLDTPVGVLTYILEKKLYFAQVVQTFLSPKRYRHCCSVAILALNIAISNHLNQDQAFIAGLLHDIAKNVDKEEERELMETFFSKYLDLPRFSYHQFIGAKFAKDYFAIKDQIILDAISFHATGKKGMSSIGMIIYASDKIEPLRDFDSQELINACIKDYFQGFREVLKANKDFLLEKKKDIANRLTVGCMQEYL